MYPLASLSDISTVPESQISCISERSSLSSALSLTTGTSPSLTLEIDGCSEKLHNDINRKLSFCDTGTLFDDLRLITETLDLCNVMFLVGKDKVPIYGVKAIMATRSRFLYQIIVAKEKELTGSTKQTKLKFALLSKLNQFRKKKFLSSEKRQASPGLLTVHLPGENPAIFRDAIQFVHSGRISASVHNIVDVIITAHSYGLTDLCSSCFHFATSFINLDSILPLLTSSLRFPQNKWIKRLLIKIWDFVDENAGLIFQTPGFEKIPKEAAMLILSRPKLRVTEAEIRKTVSDWSRRQCHVTDKETFDSLVQELLSVVSCSQNIFLKLSEDGDSLDEEHRREVHESKLEMSAYESDFSFVSPMSSNCSESSHLQSVDLSGCREYLPSDSGVTSLVDDGSL